MGRRSPPGGPPRAAPLCARRSQHGVSPDPLPRLRRPRPRLPRLVTTLAIAALAALAGPAAAQTGGGGAPPSTTPTTPAPPPPPPPALKVEKPSKKLFAREGQPNRLRLGGVWYFRQDNELQGQQRRYFSQRSLAGWSGVSVPHTWNATD